MRGVTLIELMVALLLGLMVTAAAIAVFVSNRLTYQATEALGRVQENARIAFELMARDIRQAAGNPCVNNLPVANVLNNPGGNWFTNINGWNTGLLGVDGAFTAAQPANRVANTDAIQLVSGGDRVLTVSAHDTAGHQFTVNAAHGFSAGDLILVCNARQAAIFQATAAAGSTIQHASGGVAPGNCTGELGLPQNCAAGTTFAYSAPNSVLTRLHATRWYVGDNGRGGRSLYQSRLQGGAATNEEIAENVLGMQITYLQAGQAEYVAAGAVADWGRVTAARIHLTLQSIDEVNGDPVIRDMYYIAALRNRNA
jgi:type IV pilus assembly protein PilW